MRERDIEEYLRKEVKKAGGKAYKFESPGNDGVPDRMVIFPNNTIYFVELKAPGKKPRPLQIKQMRDLKNFGCVVTVIDSKEKVDRLIDTVKRVVFGEESEEEE
ncbi:VRR-NUC domain-containing protein [Sediminibacillus massiliensis]|uniref:VRR-NUC domain-containing protein n=1 Tax=Sediminibacillus massiliensis TaxID=1926277 RepID=UPI00098844B6|nr:VRR-NUC domain-containing protein [Sediminibacillus massiliensis]